MHNLDDITGVFIFKHPNRSEKELYKREMGEVEVMDCTSNHKHVEYKNNAY